MTHTRETTYEKTFFWVTFTIALFVYLFNLGDIDALRQGTEGFYLKITKEMFQNNSFITPLYDGAPHWSKPPLQFWLTFPFYFLFGGVSLFAARLPIVLVSLFSLVYISKWLRRHFEIQTYLSFIFFVSTIGFIKYSRIFMMEIPLTMFTLCGTFLYYDYIATRDPKYFAYSAIVLGLSSLIKGPVSLVMAFGGIGIFHVYLLITQGRFIIKRPVILLLLSTFIGSIWYLISYFNYGQEFINYFFLRENFGKFTTQSYPMQSVIQGLLVYGMPWTLFFPLAIYFFSKKLKDNFDVQMKTSFSFVFINFFVFFLLWLVPTQRSHHYAIPSLPLFLILILVSCFGPFVKSFYFTTFRRLFRWHFYFLSFLNFLFICVVAFVLIANPTLPDNYLIFRSIVTLVVLICTFIVFFGPFNDFFKFMASMFAISVLWSFFVPSFYLPMIPDKVVSLCADKPVSVVLRKPFFAEEALGKKVTVLSKNDVETVITNNPGLYIVPETLALSQNLNKNSTVLYKWPRWKRRLRAKEIFSALKRNKIEDLKDYFLLLER